jgi:hypothetical protein
MMVPRKDLEESGLLSLQFKDIPYLERIGFVTKSDNLLSDSNDKEEQFRRRGVEFKWLAFSTGKSSRSLSNKMPLPVHNNLFQLVFR